MRKYIYYLAVIIIAVASTACDSDNETIIHTPASVNVGNKEIVLDDSNTYELSYSTSHDWSISITDTAKAAWYEISPSEGKAGNGKISIKALANDSFNDRKIHLTLKSEEAEETVSVFQEFGCGVTDIYILDEAFRAYCIKNFDTNGDGLISSKEAVRVTDIELRYGDINTLKGIEFFSSLRNLDIRNNYNLKEVNVSRNKRLKKIIVNDCNLESIHLSGNTELEYLDCAYNSLSHLDISNNPALNYLNCAYNKLTSLDTGNASRLARLNCRENKLTSVDLSKNTELTFFGANYNYLTFLDMTNCTKLTEIQCYSYYANLSEIWLNKALENSYVYINVDWDTKIIYK